MKKVLILAAVAAIAATACNKTYEVNPTPGVPIGFGTWTEHLTKAEQRTPGTNTFLAGDTFNVYGYKTITANTVTTNTVVFNGDVVTAYDANNASAGDPVSYWKYETLRFWDPAATSYTFFAVSPSGQLSDAPAETGKFVTNEITFGGHDNDILIANKKTVDKGTGYSSDAVELTFNHMASLVDIKVKMDASLQTAGAIVKISSAALNNIRNKGSFTVTGYSNVSPYAPTFDSYGWTPDATPTTRTYDWNPAGLTEGKLVVTAYNGYSTEHTAETITGTPQDMFTNFVLMPQDLNPAANLQNLTLSYTIETGTAPNINTSTYDNVVVNLKEFHTTDTNNNSGVAITGWEPGKHYVYYVTIGANAITFTGTIKPWVDVTGYNYLVK